MTEVFAGGRSATRGLATLVGHRGGRGESWPPENTIAAFARAHAEGARAIELDVRTCASGDVVVMHDGDLARMTGGMDRRRVARLRIGDLARAWIVTTHQGSRSSAEHIPTLDDVLDWARGRVALNVEAKHDVADRFALARGIARVLGRHEGVEVLLSSFDPTLLAMLALVAPGTPRAWLTHEGQRPWEPAWRRIAIRAPIQAVHLERTLASPSLVSALRSAGKRVGVWTVNDPREARDLTALGVDWLITDDVGALRSGPA